MHFMLILLFKQIPLYGGMQIRSFASFKNPLQLQQNPNQVPPATQLIFAVMASPEVLKKSTRNQMDNPEQLSLVELMCEFVEAMNPGIVLSKYVIRLCVVKHLTNCPLFHTGNRKSFQTGTLLAS